MRFFCSGVSCCGLKPLSARYKATRCLSSKSEMVSSFTVATMELLFSASLAAVASITLARKAGGGRRAIRLDREVPRGAELAIDASELPPPDPDSYYVFQLVGLQAVDEDGAALGRVVEVHPGAANDNVELEDGTLVPLVDDAIREVSVATGRIVVARSFLL